MYFILSNKVKSNSQKFHNRYRQNVGQREDSCQSLIKNQMSCQFLRESDERLVALGTSAGFLSFPFSEKVDNISTSLSADPVSRANLTASSRDLKYSPLGLQ